MSPTLSLQLRIRWLEALLIGVRQEVASKGKNVKGEEKGKGKKAKKLDGNKKKQEGEEDEEEEGEEKTEYGEDGTEGDLEDEDEVHTLMRQAEDVQLQLKGVVESHEAIRKFMDNCKHFHMFCPLSS